MKQKAIGWLCAATIVGPGSAWGATWNVFTKVMNDSAVFFFDADTVTRKGGAILVWVKHVNLQKPGIDGAWTTVQRAAFSCAARTWQRMASSSYDAKGEFIRSYPASEIAKEVVPGTAGEGLLEVVCSRGFPGAKDPHTYMPIADNDIPAYARNVKEWFDSKTDQSPK